MSEDRKAAILRAVVQEYIESANPVGSGRVADRSGIDVSTATIRNELVLLEEEGFLVQPHTSAGRIPTEKANRFFVDGLPGPGRREAADREEGARARGKAGQGEHLGGGGLRRAVVEGGRAVVGALIR